MDLRNSMIRCNGPAVHHMGFDAWHKKTIVFQWIPKDSKPVWAVRPSSTGMIISLTIYQKTFISLRVSKVSGKLCDLSFLTSSQRCFPIAL